MKNIKALILLFTIAYTQIYNTAHGQLNLYPETLPYTTNGAVSDIKVWKDKLLISGDFQEIYRNKNGLAKLKTDQSVDFDLPELQAVNQVVSDNKGGLIVHGWKSNSPSGNSFPLLQYDSNGNESRIFGNSILYGINRIFSIGDTLWIGGSFTKYTQLSGSLTEYDNSSSSYKPILPYINQFIIDFSVDDGMGGYFTAGDNYWIPGKHFSRFLHLDAAGNPDNKDFAAKGTIRYMERQDTVLMISGDFRQNGDSSDLVIFNIPSWTRWNLTLLTDGTINNTIIADGYLYVGGSFNTINGQARRNLARINLSTGTIDSWDPNPNKAVNAFEFYQNEILIAGEYDTIFGARNRAIIGINQNNVNSISRSIAVSARVNDLLVKGDTLFAGEEYFFVPNAQYPNYQWFISSGTLISGQGTDSILLKINPPTQDSIWIKSVATNLHGCVGDTMHFSTWTLVISVQDIEKSAVHLYPQPAQSVVMVRSKTNHALKFRQLTDISGKTISVNTNYHESGFDLDVRHLLPGIYVLTIEENNQLITKKIMIGD